MNNERKNNRMPIIVLSRALAIGIVNRSISERIKNFLGEIDLGMQIRNSKAKPGSVEYQMLKIILLTYILLLRT